MPWRIGLAILVLIAGAEAAVRVTVPRFDPARQLHFVDAPGSFPMLGPANERLYQWQPAGDFSVTIDFDRYGLRSGKEVAKAPEDAIFVVGDFFPFGWGVEQTERFSDLLQQRLQGDIYNIAIRGNLPTGHLKLIHYVERLGAKVHRLIITLPLEYVVRRYGEENNMPVPPLQPAAPRVKQWLKDHSALYQASIAIVEGNDTLRAMATRLHLAAPVDRFVNLNKIDDTAMTTTVNVLKTIAAQYDVLLVLVPNPALLEGHNVEAETWVHDTFAARLAAEHIPYVDLQPTLAAQPARYLFPHEHYWNAAAHAATADVLAPAITQRWGVAPR